MEELHYRALPEEDMYVDLPNTDGLKIKGILRGTFDMPLVVIMHGLTGEANELLPYLSARYLYERGFASLRLYMYNPEPNTRDLIDCTLQTHADDFDTVINFLRTKNVPKLFAAGHSYGGATILLAKSKLDAAVLWDPSHGLAFQDENREKQKREARQKQFDDFDAYLSGPGYVLAKAISHEQQTLGDTTDWAAGKGYPLKIISAAKGVLSELGKRYVAVADEPKSLITIEDAHHNFEDSDEVMLQLFKETADWLKEYS
ncbi:MAG TPA: alpha/beta fold hydrolase [Candidatus Saccharimonadales bacterium]